MGEFSSQAPNFGNSKVRENKMKLVIALLGAGHVLARTHGAQWEHLQNQWHSTKMGLSRNSDSRKVMELFTLSSIANYGCWCRFNNYNPYRGPTMDPMDADCKTWHLNYQCMVNDFGGSCNEAVLYNDTLTQLVEPFDESVDYVAECAARNPGSECQATACAVDAHFFRGIVNYLADNTLNQTLNGFFGFDGSACGFRQADAATTASAPIFTDMFTTTEAPADEMTATTLTPPWPRSDCCGPYPERFPFKVQQGRRQCCVNHTYDTGLLECCADGSTAMIGSCP